MIDKPVQGAGLPPSANIRRQGSVPEVARVVNQPGAAVAQNADQKRTEQGIKSAGGSVQQMATLEKMLPIEILKSPVLMKTEWAWRRLLVALTQPGHDYIRDETNTIPWNTHSESGLPPAQDERTVGRANPVQPQSLPDNEPSSATNIPDQAMGNEMVRSPNDSYHHAVSDSPVNPGMTGQQTGFSPLTEMAVKALWTTLSALAGTQRAADWVTHLPSSFNPSALIPFTDVKSHHFTGDVPDKVKEWSQADRLISATRNPDTPQIGGGLFVLPAPLNDQPMNTVRWNAQRRTRTTNQGQLVHQLTLEVRVDSFPVKIQLFCARPSLTVRVETNHFPLRHAMEQRLENVQVGLTALGWRLDRWTIGDLQTPEEEGL